MLRQPGVKYNHIVSNNTTVSDNVINQVEIVIKYAGYIDRQLADAQATGPLEQKRVRDDAVGPGLEHLDQATGDEVIASYLPYLREYGRLILICPQERGYTTDPTHVRFLDMTALRATGRRLGFVPERSFSFPFPRVAGKVFPHNEFVVVARRSPGA